MGRRLLSLLLCLALLTPGRAAAAERHYVALSFDDGPSGANTERLLDALQARDVRATFFLCGYRMEQYPEQARLLAESGHELGIHGEHHSYLTQLSPGQARAEICDTAARLVALTGRTPHLLRPPGGLTDETVRQIAREQGLPIILWSVDPEDWCCEDSACVARRILEQAQPGSIILMHDLSESSVAAAEIVIDTLQNRGYSFVTVSELAELAHTQLVPGESYCSFRF